MKHWKACYVSLRTMELNSDWFLASALGSVLCLVIVWGINTLINDSGRVLLVALILIFVSSIILFFHVGISIDVFETQRALRKEFKSFATYYEEIQDAIEDDLSEKQFQLFLQQNFTICRCDDRVRCVLNSREYIDKEFDVIVKAKKHGISCRKLR